MKSEKGVIEILIIAVTIILIVILFVTIGTFIKKEIDYGVKEGQVVDKKYSSSYTTMMFCGKVMIPQYHPESYKIQIQKEIKGNIESIWLTIDKDIYHNINIGDYYKESE